MKMNHFENELSTGGGLQEFRDVKMFTNQENEEETEAVTTSFTKYTISNLKNTIESDVSERDDLDRNFGDCQMRSETELYDCVPTLHAIGSFEPPKDTVTDDESLTDDLNISGIVDLDDETLLTDFLFYNEKDATDMKDERKTEDFHTTTTGTRFEMCLPRNKVEHLLERSKNCQSGQQRRKIMSVSYLDLRSKRRRYESCYEMKQSTSLSSCCPGYLSCIGEKCVVEAMSRMLKQQAQKSEDKVLEQKSAADECFSRWSTFHTIESPDLSKKVKRVDLNEDPICKKKRWFLVNNKICSLQEADNIFRGLETIQSLRKQIEIYKQIIEYTDLLNSIPEFRPCVDIKDKNRFIESKMKYFAFSEIYDETMTRGSCAHISNQESLPQALDVKKKSGHFSKEKTERKGIVKKALNSVVSSDSRSKHRTVHRESVKKRSTYRHARSVSSSPVSFEECRRCRSPRRKTTKYLKDNKRKYYSSGRYSPPQRDTDCSTSFHGCIRRRSSSRRYRKDRLERHQPCSRGSKCGFRSRNHSKSNDSTGRLSHVGIKEDLREKINHSRSRQALFSSEGHAKKSRESQNKSEGNSSSTNVSGVNSVSKKSEKMKSDARSVDGHSNRRCSSHASSSNRRYSLSTTPERAHRREMKKLAVKKKEPQDERANDEKETREQMNTKKRENERSKDSVSDSTNKCNISAGSEASVDSKFVSDVTAIEKHEMKAHTEIKVQMLDKLEEALSSKSKCEPRQSKDHNDMSTHTPSAKKCVKIDSSHQGKQNRQQATRQDGSKEMKQRSPKRHSRSEEPPTKRFCREIMTTDTGVKDSFPTTEMAAADSDHITENAAYYQGRGGRLFKRRRPFRYENNGQDRLASNFSEICTCIDKSTSKPKSLSNTNDPKDNFARAVLDNLFGLKAKTEINYQKFTRNEPKVLRPENNKKPGKECRQGASVPVQLSSEQSVNGNTTMDGNYGERSQNSKTKKAGNNSSNCAVIQLDLQTKVEINPPEAEVIPEMSEMAFETLESCHEEQIATVELNSPAQAGASSELDIEYNIMSPMSPTMIKCTADSDIDSTTADSDIDSTIEDFKYQPHMFKNDRNVNLKSICHEVKFEKLTSMSQDYSAVSDDSFSCIEEEIVYISNESKECSLADHNYCLSFETYKEATQDVNVDYGVHVTMPMDESEFGGLFDMDSDELVNADLKYDGAGEYCDEIQQDETPIGQNMDYLISNTNLTLHGHSKSPRNKNESDTISHNNMILDSNNLHPICMPRIDNSRDVSDNSRCVKKMGYTLPVHIDLNVFSDDNPSHSPKSGPQSIYGNLSEDILAVCNSKDPRVRCLKANDVKPRNKNIFSDKRHPTETRSIQNMNQSSSPLENPCIQYLTVGNSNPAFTNIDSLQRNGQSDWNSSNLEQGKTNLECQTLSCHSVPKEPFLEESKSRRVRLFPRWPRLSDPIISSRLSKQQTMDILDEFCNIPRPLSPLPEEDGDCIRKITSKSPLQFINPGYLTNTICTHGVNMSASGEMVKCMKHMGACSVSVPCASAIQYEVCGITVVQLFGTPPGLQLQPVPNPSIQCVALEDNDENETLRKTGVVRDENIDVSVSGCKMALQEKHFCDTREDTRQDGKNFSQKYYQPNALEKLCIYSLKKYSDFQFSNINVQRIRRTKNIRQKEDTELGESLTEEIDSVCPSRSAIDNCLAVSATSLKRTPSACNFEMYEETENPSKSARYLENHATADVTPDISHMNHNNCSGNDDKTSKDQHDPKPGKSFILDSSEDMNNFQCDDMSTPIVLSAADRVYHINGGARKEPWSWLDKTSKPQKLTIQAGYGEDDGQDQSMDISSGLERFDSSQDLLSQAMESAGLSELSIDSFLRSDFNIESFIMNTEDAVGSVVDDADANEFLDSIFADTNRLDVLGCDSTLRPTELTTDTSPNITLSLQPNMTLPGCSGVQTFDLKPSTTVHQFESSCSNDSSLDLPEDAFQSQIRINASSQEPSYLQNRWDDSKPGTSYSFDQYNCSNQSSSNMLSFENTPVDYGNEICNEARSRFDTPSFHNLTELRSCVHVNDTTYISNDNSNISFTKDPNQINDALFLIPDTGNSHSELVSRDHLKNTCTRQECSGENTLDTESSDCSKGYPTYVPTPRKEIPFGSRRRELALACLERDVDPYTRASLRRKTLACDNTNRASLLEEKKTRNKELALTFQARSLVCIEKLEKQSRVRQKRKKKPFGTCGAKSVGIAVETTYCRRMSSRISTKQKEKQAQQQRVKDNSYKGRKKFQATSKRKKKKRRSAVIRNQKTAASSTQVDQEMTDAPQIQTSSIRSSDKPDDAASGVEQIQSKTLRRFLEKRDASVAMFTKQLSVSSPGMLKNIRKPVKWDTCTKVNQITTKRKCPLRISRQRNKAKTCAFSHTSLAKPLRLTDDLNRNNNAGTDKTNTKQTFSSGQKKQKAKVSIHMQGLQNKNPELLPRVGSDMENYKEVQKKLKQVHSRLVKKHGQQYKAPSTSLISSSLSIEAPVRNHSRSKINSTLYPPTTVSHNSSILDSGIDVLPSIASSDGEGLSHSREKRAETGCSALVSGSLLEKQPGSMIRFVKRMSTSYGEQLANGDAATKKRLNKVCDRYLSKKRNSNGTENKLEAAPGSIAPRLLEKSSSVRRTNPNATPAHIKGGGDSKLKTGRISAIKLNSNTLSKADRIENVGNISEHVPSSRKSRDDQTVKQSSTKKDEISDVVNANTYDSGMVSHTCTNKSATRSKTQIPRLKKPQTSSKPLNPDLVRSVRRLAAKPPSPTSRLRYKVQRWEREFGKSLLSPDPNSRQKQMPAAQKERNTGTCESHSVSNQQKVDSKKNLASKSQLEKKSNQKEPHTDAETSTHSRVLSTEEEFRFREIQEESVSTAAELESTLVDIKEFIRESAKKQTDTSSPSNKSREIRSDTQSGSETSHSTSSNPSPRSANVYNDSIKLTPMESLKQLADDIVHIHSPLNFPNLLHPNLGKDSTLTSYSNVSDASQFCQRMKSTLSQSPVKRIDENGSPTENPYSTSGKVRFQGEDLLYSKTSRSAFGADSCSPKSNEFEKNRITLESGRAIRNGFDRSESPRKRSDYIDENNKIKVSNAYQMGLGRSAMLDNIMNLVRAGESVPIEETVQCRGGQGDNTDFSENIVKLPDLKQMAHTTALRGGFGEEFVKEELDDLNLDIDFENELQNYYNEREELNATTSRLNNQDANLSKLLSRSARGMNGTMAGERTCRLPPIKNLNTGDSANLPYNRELDTSGQNELHCHRGRNPESDEDAAHWRNENRPMGSQQSCQESKNAPPYENDGKSPTDRDGLRPLESLTSLKMSIDKDFRETFKDIPSLGAYYGSYGRNTDISPDNPLEDENDSAERTMASQEPQMDLRIYRKLSPIKEMGELEESLSKEER